VGNIWETIVSARVGLHSRFMWEIRNLEQKKMETFSLLVGLLSSRFRKNNWEIKR